MKLSRRGALGAAIGGLASQIMPDVQTVAETPYPSTATAAMELGREAKAESVAFHISRLRRLASGDLKDEDRNYPTRGSGNPFEPLKSVSPSARRFLEIRHEEESWRRRTIERAIEALNEYDKTGLLRHIF